MAANSGNDPGLLQAQPGAVLPRGETQALAAELARTHEAVGRLAGRLDFFDEPSHFRSLQQAAAAQVVAAAAARPAADPASPAARKAAAASLAGQAAALAHGEASSVELTRDALARAEAWQPHINAFIAIEAADALREAARSDERRARGQARGPLDGVPMAHKDMFDRVGKVATGGTPILAGRQACADSTVARRLSQAGAVWLGGLGMAEFAASPTGINVHHGAVRNPWNTACVTGGSSSGSGAAVAAGIVAAALGSDTGGSIRLPAAMCGVSGLKPSYGLVSRAGVMPRAPSLDTVGPLGRSAEDCALLLEAVAGADPHDPTTLQVPLPPVGTLPGLVPPGSVLAVLAGEAIEALPASLAACHDEALRALRDQGFRLVERRMDWLAELYPLADAVSKCEAAALHERWMRERPQDYSAFLYARTLAGFHLPATRYIDALSLRAPMLRRFTDEVLEGVVALLLPTLAVPVPTLAAADVSRGEAVGQLITALTRLTRPFSYLGVPALSVPCGFDEAGLPVGLQVVGRPFADFELLSLGCALQGATDWHLRTPGLPQAAGQP